MITLPKNWKDGIQFRDFLLTINQYGETGILIFTIQNKDKQIFCYTQSVVIPGYEIIQSNIKKAKQIRESKTKEAYKVLCYSVKEETATLDYVIDSNYLKKPFYHKHVPITNDEWEIVLLPELNLYKP